LAATAASAIVGFAGAVSVRPTREPAGPRKAIRNKVNHGNETSYARRKKVKKNVAEGIAHIHASSTPS
jgi:hypothetical protein